MRGWVAWGGRGRGTKPAKRKLDRTQSRPPLAAVVVVVELVVVVVVAAALVVVEPVAVLVAPVLQVAERGARDWGVPPPAHNSNNNCSIDPS